VVVSVLNKRLHSQYINIVLKKPELVCYGKETEKSKVTLAEEQDMLRNNGLPST
jgi:hypothetical protein